MIKKLAKSLPNTRKNVITRASDDWNMYREKDVDDDIVYNENDEIRRVDRYLNEVLCGRGAA